MAWFPETWQPRSFAQLHGPVQRRECFAEAFALDPAGSGGGIESELTMTPQLLFTWHAEQLPPATSQCQRRPATFVQETEGLDESL